MASSRSDARALAALFAGALGIAFAPIFVRLSETGPVSTAFWRIALALPVLWAWSLAAERRVPSGTADRQFMIAAGVFFAGDLAVWHWSILLTSVANATLLANLAPVFVTLAVWLIYRQRPSALFLAGLTLALLGVATLLGGDFRLGGSEIAGDCLGLLTAIFYAGYLLAVARARSGANTATVMAWSSLVCAVVLFPLALFSGEQVLPGTAQGWMTLLGLALLSQAAGQSLIAYAMAHLQPTFSSVGLLLQPVAAAMLACVLLDEALDALELAGGLAVLAGIYLAHAAGATRTAEASKA